METMRVLCRKVPKVIAEHIISFITPPMQPGDTPYRHMLRYAEAGFYEHAVPTAYHYSSWCDILYEACRHGHIEIVRRAIRGGADNFDIALYAAEAGSNMSIFMWMLMKFMSSMTPYHDNYGTLWTVIRKTTVRAAELGNIAALAIITTTFPPAVLRLRFDDIAYYSWPPQSQRALRDYVAVDTTQFDPFDRPPIEWLRGGR